MINFGVHEYVSAFAAGLATLLDCPPLKDFEVMSAYVEL
jgi:hypothetical protein